MRNAIVWPLTSDQTDFQPYLVCGSPSEFPKMLRRELQGHLSDVLANLTFENQNALQKARSFISYMPANKTKDDTAYVVKEFVEISDELAEEIGDNEQYAQWRVRLFER